MVYYPLTSIFQSTPGSTTWDEVLITRVPPGMKYSTRVEVVVTRVPPGMKYSLLEYHPG